MDTLFFSHVHLTSHPIFISISLPITSSTSHLSYHFLYLLLSNICIYIHATQTNTIFLFLASCWIYILNIYFWRLSVYIYIKCTLNIFLFLKSCWIYILNIYFWKTYNSIKNRPKTKVLFLTVAKTKVHELYMASQQAWLAHSLQEA